jgi:Ca2+-binding RTX toxin-like protein
LSISHLIKGKMAFKNNQNNSLLINITNLSNPAEKKALLNFGKKYIASGNAQQDEQQIIKAVNAATQSWSNRLFSNDGKNIQVNVTLKFAGGGTNLTLAQADTVRQTVTYTDFKNALKNNITSANDRLAFSNLPSNTRQALYVGKDSFSDLNSVTITNPVAKVLKLGSFSSSVDATRTLDSTIYFEDFKTNSNDPRKWFFKTASGTESKPENQDTLKDFVGLLTHELGHVLGFESTLDGTDPKATIVRVPGAIDIFRSSSTVAGKGKIDLSGDSDSTPSALISNPQYFSLDGGKSELANPLKRRFLTNGADKTRQASHWTNYTDGVQSGRAPGQGRINGLMSPDVLSRLDGRISFGNTTGQIIPGVNDRIKPVDLLAFDAIGWSLKPQTRVSEGSAIPGINADKIVDKSYTGTDNDDLLIVAPPLVASTAAVPIGGATIFGKDGFDTITGGISNDTLYAGLGGDEVYGGLGNDFIQGNEGSDLLFGGVGDDSVAGGADNDEVYGDSGNDTVTGGFGTDTLFGDDGNDSLFGDEGDDVLDGGFGGDTLSGGNGDDVYVIDNALDTITGETVSSGIDQVFSAISLNLTSNIEGLTLTGTGNITGAGNGLDNFLIGNDQKNILNGLAGNDQVYGGAGEDTLKGGLGDDSLDGAGESGLFDPNAPTAIDGVDRLEGNEGDDTYYISDNDVVVENFNEGSDTVISSLDNYLLANNVENLQLVGASLFSGFVPTGIAAMDSEGSETIMIPNSGNKTNTLPEAMEESLNATGNKLDNEIVGSNGRNAIAGSDGNDKLDGGGGDDNLYGDAGNDSLIGALGNDSLNGNEGNDNLDGGLGDDRLWGDGGNDKLQGGDGADILVGGDNNDMLAGDDGADSLYGDGGEDTITGGMGRDQINGNDGNDSIAGGQDDDTIYGDGGNDTIWGEQGNDILYGGDGDDLLGGGLGVNTVTGGSGRDRFVLQGNGSACNITDFRSGEDKIQLQQSIFAELKTLAGISISEFAVVGNDAAVETSEKIIVYSTASGKLFYNSNGLEAGLGRSGELLATLNYQPTLLAEDFVVSG